MSGEWMDMLAPPCTALRSTHPTTRATAPTSCPTVHDWFFFRDPAPLKEFGEGGKTFGFFLSQLPMWWPKIGAWTLLTDPGHHGDALHQCAAQRPVGAQRAPRVSLGAAPIALTEEAGRGRHRSGRTSSSGAHLRWSLPSTCSMASRFSTRSSRASIFAFWATSTRPLSRRRGTRPAGLPSGSSPISPRWAFSCPPTCSSRFWCSFFVRKAQQIIAYSIGNEQGTFGGRWPHPSPPYFLGAELGGVSRALCQCALAGAAAL